jgi:glycine C-acetyltransferase
LYFGTFAKAFAGIGGFIAGPKNVINYLRYNMRSQIYAKALPMPMVIGIQKRLEMIKTMPELREKLWNNVHTIQSGLREAGFDIGKTQSPVTPVFLKGGDSEASNLIVDLRENYSIFCSIVTYPVVPKGIFLIRIIPSAAHSLDDINITIKAFKEVKSKLDSGYYKKLDIPRKRVIED